MSFYDDDVTFDRTEYEKDSHGNLSSNTSQLSLLISS